jgi:DNA-binding NarL/FixJ family response regulator
MSTRILIVDENNLLRQGLRSLLSEHFVVVGEACDGKSAISEAMAVQPEVVLMDIALPGMNGMEVTSHLKRRFPAIRVIMLTSLKSQDYLRESLRAGVDGYLLKNASYEELLTAMRSVVHGKKYLSPDVSAHLVDGFLHPDQVNATHSPLTRLTARERSILQLIAEGRTNRTTAEFLSVSPKTVEKHRARLMHKLGLRNAAELILVALELGLIERPGSVSRLVDDAIV